NECEAGIMVWRSYRRLNRYSNSARYRGTCFSRTAKPDQIILRPVKAFSSFAIRKLASTALNPHAHIVSDGLACFAAVTQAGCLHTSIKTGSGKQAARAPAFKWVNTALGNIKAALVGTYRAVREKHVPRYLAEFEYRFNRRYDLQTMIPRLAFVALRTAPMPYRLLKTGAIQTDAGQVRFE